MYAILKEQVAVYSLEQQVVRVVRLVDYSMPSGMLASLFTAEGQLLGSNGAASPVAVPAPTAEGQILRARLTETLKMIWESVDLSQLTQTAVKTAAYTAINNDHVLVDASGVGADFEIALPATPTAGNKVRVTLVDDHASYKVTIGRNGSLVNGGTDTTALSLVNKGDSVYFEYTGATLGWVTSTLAALINGSTAKATPVDADRFGFWDSVSGLLNHVTWANIKATLLTYFYTIFPAKDGWMPVSDSWTYASASTINVPSGAASLYQKGDRIKFTQTTVKYFVIEAVADTLLTVAVNTDYVVANAAISAISYSHQQNPIGYPHWFACAAPTWTVSEIDNASGGQPTTNEARLKIDGNQCTVHLSGSGTKAGTNWYFSCSHIGPTIANTTSATAIGVCNAGWAANDHNGVTRWVAGNLLYFTFDSDRTIPDNQAIAVFSTTVTFEF